MTCIIARICYARSAWPSNCS